MGDILGAARRAVRRWLYQAGCAGLTDHTEQLGAGGRVVKTNFVVKGIPVTAQIVTVSLRALAPTRGAPR